MNSPSSNPSPSPSPLVPQGSLLEQKNKGRSRVKFAFFCVVGVHVAALMVALLSQGCKRDQTATTDTTSPTYNETNLPALPLETNIAYIAPNNAPPPLPVEPSASQQQEYVIQRGDTYSTIVKKYPGVTVKAIQDAPARSRALFRQPAHLRRRRLHRSSSRTVPVRHRWTQWAR